MRRCPCLFGWDRTSKEEMSKAEPPSTAETQTIGMSAEVLCCELIRNVLQGWWPGKLPSGGGCPRWSAAGCCPMQIFTKRSTLKPGRKHLSSWWVPPALGTSKAEHCANWQKRNVYKITLWFPLLHSKTQKSVFSWETIKLTTGTKLI